MNYSEHGSNDIAWGTQIYDHLLGVIKSNIKIGMRPTCDFGLKVGAFIFTTGACFEH